MTNTILFHPPNGKKQKVKILEKGVPGDYALSVHVMVPKSSQVAFLGEDLPGRYGGIRCTFFDYERHSNRGVRLCADTPKDLRKILSKIQKMEYIPDSWLYHSLD